MLAQFNFFCTKTKRLYYSVRGEILGEATASVASAPPPHVASPEPAASGMTVSCGEPGLVGPLRHHLDLTSSKQRVIQSHCGLDRILVCKLYVGKPFGMHVKLVA